METAITALILMGIILLAILGLTERSLVAQNAITEATVQMQQRESDIAKTNLAPLSGSTSGQGRFVYLTLKNTGVIKLADFTRWDVILEYSDGANHVVRWFPHGNGANFWSEQIYQVASPPTAEVFDPGILNPGEETVITVEVSPWVGRGTTNLATITTPNGLTASTTFSH